jgi:outer membrane protein assembly factor BamB
VKLGMVALVICLLSMTSTTEGADNWPMLQHDPQHTGYSPSNMPQYLRKVWAYEKYGEPEAYFSVSKENLVVVQMSSISSLGINNGSVLWSMKPKNGILWNFPAIANNRIYIGVTEEILCLDADTGKILWNHEVRFLDFASSPIFIGEHVIIGGGDTQTPFQYSQKNVKALEHALKHAKRLLCLNAKTGEVLWEFYAADIVDATPAYFNGRVYINDGDRNIYCLNEQTGNLVWERKIEQTTCSSLSLDGKRIFVGTSEGIVCLKLETGDILWKFNCENSISETPAVAYDKVFSGSFDGTFYCLNAEDGKLVWKIETGTGIPKPKNRISCPAVVADGKVAFGTGSGLLYIVDAKSGKIYESLDLGESSVTALSLSNGKLFVGQENGKITCFEGSESEGLSSGIFTGIVIALLSIALSLVLWILTKRR